MTEINNFNGHISKRRDLQSRGVARHRLPTGSGAHHRQYHAGCDPFTKLRDTTRTLAEDGQSFSWTFQNSSSHALQSTWSTSGFPFCTRPIKKIPASCRLPLTRYLTALLIDVTVGLVITWFMVRFLDIFFGKVGLEVSFFKGRRS